jgi:hypothetical protein
LFGRDVHADPRALVAAVGECGQVEVGGGPYKAPRT